MCAIRIPDGEKISNLMNSEMKIDPKEQKISLKMNREERELRCNKLAQLGNLNSFKKLNIHSSNQSQIIQNIMKINRCNTHWSKGRIVIGKEERMVTGMMFLSFGVINKMLDDIELY